MNTSLSINELKRRVHAANAASYWANPATHLRGQFAVFPIALFDDGQAIPDMTRCDFVSPNFEMAEQERLRQVRLGNRCHMVQQL